MNYSSKKICIFDIDGVLYYNDIYNKINNNFFMKHNIIFCTGRGMKRTNDVVSKICKDNPKYIIINNGATILKNNKIIYEKCIKKRYIRRALSSIKKIENIAFINIITINKKGYQYFDPNNLIKDYNYYECTDKFDEFDSFKNYCIDNSIVKLTIVLKNTNSRIIDSLIKLGFIKSDKNTFCLINTKINKLTAIKIVAKVEKFKLKDIVYFGNDYNDYFVFKNKSIKSVYVYDDIDRFLKEKADYSINFYKLKEFLDKEVDNI